MWTLDTKHAKDTSASHTYMGRGRNLPMERTIERVRDLVHFHCRRQSRTMSNLVSYHLGAPARRPMIWHHSLHSSNSDSYKNCRRPIPCQSKIQLPNQELRVRPRPSPSNGLPRPPCEGEVGAFVIRRKIKLLKRAWSFRKLETP
jgi:hypothetical protein